MGTVEHRLERLREDAVSNIGSWIEPLDGFLGPQTDRWIKIIAVAMVAGVLLWRIFTRGRPSGEDELVGADVESWRGVGLFRLQAAAALWVDEDPTKNLSQKGYAAFQRLKEAVTSGDLHPQTLRGEYVNKETLVTRQELANFAKKAGEEPRFLFNQPSRRTYAGVPPLVLGGIVLISALGLMVFSCLPL